MAYPASYKNWGTWVVFPLPVSPLIMTTGCSLIFSIISCSSAKIGRARRASWKKRFLRIKNRHTLIVGYYIEKGKSNYVYYHLQRVLRHYHLQRVLRHTHTVSLQICLRFGVGVQNLHLITALILAMNKGNIWNLLSKATLIEWWHTCADQRFVKS